MAIFLLSLNVNTAFGETLKLPIFFHHYIAHAGG